MGAWLARNFPPDTLPLFFGIMIPMIIIIVLCARYVFRGRP